MAPRLFGVAPSRAFPYLRAMDVHLNNPEIKAKIDRWVAETGRGPDELLEDAMAGVLRGVDPGAGDAQQTL